MWKRFIAKVIIKMIRRYFPEGLTFDGSTAIWKWTYEFESEICGKCGE